MNCIETTQKVEFCVCYLTTTPYKRFDSYRYRIEVTVSGGVQDKGLIIDFDNLRNCIIKVVPNHRYVFCKADNEACQVADTLQKIGITSVGYDFVISAENLVKHFAQAIQEVISDVYNGLCVEDVKLYETPNSYTRWTRLPENTSK